MEKKTAAKARKNVKKTSRPKKHQSHLLIQAMKGKKKGCPRTIKGKKMSPLLGVKEEVQRFLDLQKDSRNLTIEEKVEKIVFMAGLYEGYELSYVALCDTKYLKRVLKMSGLEKTTKDLIKQALAKTLPFLTLCTTHTRMSPTTKTIRARVCYYYYYFFYSHQKKVLSKSYLQKWTI